jgi:CheY-like chemotaxis protein
MALEACAAERPDVVLLDLALPTKSGLEVLRELKGTRATSDIPVIVVSAYGTLMNEQDAHHTVGVIQKPFDYDDLVSQVEQATNASVSRPLALLG